uniref:RRM domain-containing protein n=1 Tax=Panagrolaimus sp. JU765 TaxID=591449 RepID=A0AC34QPH8_9BILA
MPKPLFFAYSVFDGAETDQANKIEEFESFNLRSDLENLGSLASTCKFIVATNEDVRQILHPAATAVRDEYWQLPNVFYSFVNADPLLLALYSNEKVLENNNNECSSSTVADRIRLISAALRNCVVDLENHVETVQQTYVSGVCVDSFVDNGLVVRTRGLPWQASDQDVALFFSGLNIAPGGIALCLSPDGRRNGEALVRFESCIHREMALARHRQFLHNRYIEVYRATGDDFLKVAVGSDLQAVQFASRQAAMIVRMRGLPFDCTEAQIEAFFGSDGESHGIIDQGILFVSRPDGRPSGDAFVLFADDASGKRALAKHKNRIGSRYIELFRTTQAEVQQVFNRSIRTSPQTTLQHLLPNILSHPKRDCIRLRGLPYEASVKDVADFLGPHSRRIAFQGVHMIFNNQGHPSGECFIQMDSESSAMNAAHSMHNKYMEIGKKKRYIEVFQCSAEEITTILNSASAGQISPNAASVSSTSSSAGSIFPNAAALLPIPAFRTTPASLGLLGAAQTPGLIAGATPFFPAPALTPDQILFASAQFGQFPLYSPEHLQLAAQIEASNQNANLIQQQIAAAHFQQQFSSGATLPPEFVPISSTLIHT